MNMVYEIIQKHKGEIKVASTVGEGASFTITLPIAFAGEMADDTE